MPKFSHETPTIESIAITYKISIDSLAAYRTSIARLASSLLPVPDEFVGLTVDGLNAVFATQRIELDTLLCFSLLSTVEAMFRMDYSVRCQARKPRDDVTARLRAIYREQGLRADFSEDILHARREARPELAGDIGDLTAAFRYRHWLAHGRCWVPKRARRYDFWTVYRICEQATAPLAPLVGSYS